MRGSLAGLVFVLGVLGLPSEALASVAGQANTPRLVGYPQAQSARIIRAGSPTDGSPGVVQACFQTQVRSPGARGKGKTHGFRPADFLLVGSDVNSISAGASNGFIPASSVTIDKTDRRCLRVRFRAASGSPGANYLGSFTKLDIAGPRRARAKGAVTDLSSPPKTNPPEAVQLDGSDLEKFITSGGNAGPVLGPQGWSPNATPAGTITINLDKVIFCPTGGAAAALAADFGYYSSAGAGRTNASTLVACDPTGSPQGTGQITVGGFPAGVPPPASAVRVFYDASRANATRHSMVTAGTNSFAATTVAPPAGTPVNPYVTAVSQDGDNFTLTYSQTVHLNDGPGGTFGHGMGGRVDVGNICAYPLDGAGATSFFSRTCATSGSASDNHVVVRLPALQAFSDKAALLADNGGAVLGVDGTPSAVSSTPLRSAQFLTAGDVDSVVLHQCTMGPGPDQLTFNFVGSKIAESPAPSAANFWLVDDNGAVTVGTTASVARGTNNAVVQFGGGDVGSAVACGANGQQGGAFDALGSARSSAVRDLQGKGADVNVIAIGPAAIGGTALPNRAPARCPLAPHPCAGGVQRSKRPASGTRPVGKRFRAHTRRPQPRPRPRRPKPRPGCGYGCVPGGPRQSVTGVSRHELSRSSRGTG